MVFAEPTRQFYLDPRLRAVNRDLSIWTALSGPTSSHPSTGIVQKLMPARVRHSPTGGGSATQLNRRAVSNKTLR